MTDQPVPAADCVFEPWPDNLPLEEQVQRLADVLLAFYADYFDRSEGAMEKAARILHEIAQETPV